MDFAPLNVIFMFNANDTEFENLGVNETGFADVTFVTAPDGIIEGDEFFFITIEPGENYYVGNTSVASVRIIDFEFESKYYTTLNTT